MRCDQTVLDGAYVLGALDPRERRGFERHLEDCAQCSDAVRELAGLPGLLAHVTPSVLEPVDDPPVPDTLLPAVLRDVRRGVRRRSLLTAGIAAGVTAIGAAGLAASGVWPTGAAPTPSTASSATARALPMDAVGSGAVAAQVALASVSWGTRLDLTCSYTDTDPAYPTRGATAYALVVRARDGRTEQVATWRGLPGRTMHLSAATATAQADIAAVEVRDAAGATLLRLAL